MDRTTPTRADIDDRLPLPPISPPEGSGTEKKESGDHRHNPACQRSGRQSLSSSRDRHLCTARTATSLSASPQHRNCQSTARPIQPASVAATFAPSGSTDAIRFYNGIALAAHLKARYRAVIYTLPEGDRSARRVPSQLDVSDQ